MGWVSSRGATPLCIFTGNLTKERYVDILNGYLLETANVLYGDGWVFQHDNDPKHKAHYTKTLMRDQNIDMLDWASYSPDLNPIQNIWGLLKDNIIKKGIRSLAVAQEEVVQFWGTLSHDFLHNLIDSMPRRIESCIAVQGGLTKY